jgi:hypothetical protein
LRYPTYLGLNVGLEKPFRFLNHNWAIRGSLINVTDHPNPTAVVNNVDASNYLSFSGREGIAFSFRLRLVTGQ